MPNTEESDNSRNSFDMSIVVFIVIGSMFTTIIGYSVYQLMLKFMGIPWLAVSITVVTILTTVYLVSFIYSRLVGIEDEETTELFIELNQELKTAIHQYLIFFNDYVRITKDSSIKINIEQVEGGLNLKTDTTSTKDLSKLNDWLKEYIEYIYVKLENGTFDLNNVDSKELKLFVVKLENQISNLKTNLRIAKLEIDWLRDNSEYLKQLAQTLSNNKFHIQNQYIQDGNQQFADKIENNEDK